MATYSDRARMRVRKAAATVAPKRAAKSGAAPSGLGGGVRRAQAIDRAVDEMVNGTRIVRRN